MKKYLPVALILAGVAILPAYLRAMTVSGPSDAPTLLLGDQVLVDMSAYQVNVPYTAISLWRRKGPDRGDMVMFNVPNRPNARGFKRLIGLPGDTAFAGRAAAQVIINGGTTAFSGGVGGSPTYFYHWNSLQAYDDASTYFYHVQSARSEGTAQQWRRAITAGSGGA